MAEPLSFDDAQILRLESDVIKGHTGKVLMLGPSRDGERLDASALRARVADRIGAIPRLRQRVDDAHASAPAWVEDDPDLEWHVAEADAASPLDDAGLRELAGDLFAERLDHDRPLWRIDVVPVADGGSALIGRYHHAMVDGVSAIKLVGELLWDPVNTPVADAGSASKAAVPKVGASVTPKRGVRSVPGALRRELRPGHDTALDRHIGSEREVAWSSFPLTRLKAIEHRAGEGVTVNDVVLATVAGGLRNWLEGGGKSIRVQIPVSLHHRDEDEGDAGQGWVGNRDSFLNVNLPLAEPDALTRLLAVNTETSERKLDHDAETLYDFFHALGRFRPLYEGVTRLTSGPREFALSVSNVPGPRERPSVLGHEVTGLVSFAEPADRHALRVSVVSLGGDLAFGLCSDPDAIAELDELASALNDSVAELEEACGC